MSVEQPNQTQLKQIKVVPNRLSKPNQNKLHRTKPSRARAAQLLYRPVLVMLLIKTYIKLLRSSICGGGFFLFSTSSTWQSRYKVCSNTICFKMSLSWFFTSSSIRWVLKCVNINLFMKLWCVHTVLECQPIRNLRPPRWANHRPRYYSF